jgi:hypothetical protein
MPTYTIHFCWEVPISVNATAEIVADTQEQAERLFLETKGDPRQMKHLDLEDSWIFDPRDFVGNGHPIEIEEIETLEENLQQDAQYDPR